MKEWIGRVGEKSKGKKKVRNQVWTSKRLENTKGEYKEMEDGEWRANLSLKLRRREGISKLPTSDSGCERGRHTVHGLSLHGLWANNGNYFLNR